MADSGANIKLIHPRIADKFAAKFPPVKTSATVRVADSKQSAIKSKITLPVSIGGREKSMTFFIFPKMQYDCIIGLNDFQKVVIDRENSLITLDDCKTDLVEYGQFVKLSTLNNITVQPFGLTPLPVRCPISNSDGCLVVGQGPEGYLYEHGLSVVEATYQVQNTLMILVENFTGCKIEVPNNIPIADGLIMEQDRAGNFRANELIALFDSDEQDLEFKNHQLSRELRFQPSKSLAFKEVKIGEQLDSSQKKRIEELLSNIRQAFSTCADDIGMLRNTAFRIHLKDESAEIYEKPRAPKFAIREKGERVIKRWLDNKIIKEAASRFNIPLFFIAKRDGTARPILDARALNLQTIPDRWPIPCLRSLMARVSETFSSTKGEIYVSSSDIQSAFNQIRLFSEDTEKCAFSYGDRQYQAQRMLFGLRNSPSCFAQAVSRIFKDDPEVVILMDDLLIISKSFDEHLLALERVFTKLRESGITLKTSKTYICSSSFEYLGFTVTKSGIAPIRTKVSAILEYPRPRNRKQVRSFIGLGVFYRHFIKEASAILEPLHKLCTPSKAPFTWKAEHEESFEKFKKNLAKVVEIAHRDPSLPLVLVTDGSTKAIAGALHQRLPSGKLAPLGFFSRALCPAESKLASRYIELAAVVNSLEYFEDTVYLQPVTVISDHFSLQKVLEEKRMRKSMPVRVINLIQRLTRFQVSSIEHVKGTDPILIGVDALSRAVPISEFDDYAEDDHIDRGVANMIRLVPGCDEIYSALQIETRRARRARLKKSEGPIMTIKETGYTAEQLVRIQQNDPFLDKLSKKGTVIKDERGIFVDKANNDRIYLPYELALQVASFIHVSKAHPGTICLSEILNRKFLMKNAQAVAREICNACLKCLQIKPRPVLKNLDVPKPEIALSPWSRVFLDLCDFGGPDEDGYRYLLAACDQMSRFVVCKPLKTKSATEVAHGILDIILSNNAAGGRFTFDNGLEFVNSEVTELLEKFNIKISRISPYSPQGNLCERKFRSLGIKAKILRLDLNIWSREICFVLWHMNNTPTQALGNLTPSEVLTGRPMPYPTFCLPDNLNETDDPEDWANDCSGWLQHIAGDLQGKFLARTNEGELPESPAQGTLPVGAMVAYWSPQKAKTSKKTYVGFQGVAKIVRYLRFGSYEIEKEGSGERIVRNVRHLRLVNTGKDQ